MAADAERHLLFGLLALQNGLIDQVQLVAAFQAWTRDKARPLADYLVARGDLDADDRAAVEALAARHLKKHGDAEKSLASLPAGRSTRERLAALGDPELTAAVAQSDSDPAQSTGDADRTTTYAVGSATGDGRRFRVLRPHARGGLGAVFVALDEELHREVALKEILDGHADDPVSRQRFLLEAEITGGLEHPGIVPVYGLGTYGDGRPYYAMRFIRGDSLKEAVGRFHADEALKADPGRRSLELRKLLRRFVDVCDAIEYAHSRGVLHRDLKPGNVIVGRHGETLVVDWGLAKSLGRVEPGADPGERPLTPSPASGSAETLPGSVLGTPAYMSPEQAAGDLEHLGPRSDVYSLGATLYCVLTGRPPFRGEAGDVLRAVQRGDFPAPRKLDPTVDRPLEAICLKAMALDPKDRYASARALAEDVERWTADEPVSAWREPFRRRARRWARRHRTLVSVAGVLVVAGVTALAAGTVLIGRQKARAEANFRLARAAVDDMYTQVAEKWLAQEPQMETLQREFLLKALRFYEQFARPAGASAEMRREAGKAARRAAEIRGRLGEHAAAASSFGDAIRALSTLPGDDLAAQELAVTYNRRGWFLWITGRSPEADLRRALALGTALARRPLAAAEVRKELARTESSMGIVLMATGRHAEAEAAHRRALALRAALARESPAVPEFRQDQARSHGHLGDVLKAVGRYREALGEFDRAVALAEALVAEASRDPRFRQGLIHHLDDRGNQRVMLGRTREAEADLRRATALAERLAADFPGYYEYQDLHSTTRRDLANLLKAHGQERDARQDYGQAIAVAESLMRRHPDVPAHRRSLAVHHSNLGGLLHSVGRPDEAEPEFALARDLAESLAAEFPDRIDYRLLRAKARLNLALLMKATGRWAESEPVFDRAVADLESLRREFPAVPELRALLVEALDGRGFVLRALARPRGAESCFEAASSLADALAIEFPEVPHGHAQAATVLAHLGQVALDRRETARARGLQERAIRHVEAALALNPDSIVHQNILLQNLSILLQAQAQAGDAAALDATARRIEALASSPRAQYNAACYLALAHQGGEPATS